MMRTLALAVATMLGVTAMAQNKKPIDQLARVPLGTMTESACSPKAPSDAWHGVLIAVPNAVDWGEPLPLCGLARLGATERPADPKQAFGLRVSVEPAAHAATGWIGPLGDVDASPIAEPPHAPAAPREVLARMIETTYFNFGAFAHIDVPGPGKYDVTAMVDTPANASPPRTVTVRAGDGWRVKLARAVAQDVFKKKLWQDLAEYLADFNRPAPPDTPAPAPLPPGVKPGSPEAQAAIARAYREQMDESARRTAARRRPLWDRGFAKHKPLAGLARPMTGRDLDGLARYTARLVSEACNEKKSNDVKALYLGILGYELPAK